MIEATAEIWVRWNCPECGRRLSEVMDLKELAARYSEKAVIEKTHNTENALGMPCLKQWFMVSVQYPNVTVELYTS